MENPIITALAARVRRAGADPLVTWYRPADGARTELSGRTFANWVDKTANLLDALGVEGPISAPLNLAHPGHWMSLVWPVAAWQHGCGYTVGVPEPSAAVVVVGPDRPEPVTGAITIACSLHPLGLGLRHLPEEVLDFTTEALAESDAHWSVPVDPEALAWADADRSLSHAQLATVAPEPARVLVRPLGAWPTLAAAILGPLLGGGSAVVVEGEVTPDALARIGAAERASAPVA